ncbi:MAG: hypothetical protein GY842_06185 [bacterium]|nr:hypothetical protein [bacterium]
MKSTRTTRFEHCWLAAATLFAGGTVLGTCELRLRDAFVTTTQATILTAVECLPTMLGADENSACDVFAQSPAE